MKPRSPFSSFLFLCLISLLLFLLPSPKVAWPFPSLETLAKVGKVLEKLMEERNLAQKAIHSLEKRGLFERFLGKGGVEISQFKRSPALMEFMQEFKQLGHSEAEAEKLGSKLIAELGESEAKTLMKVLGRDRLAKLLPHLSPKEIQEFLTLLGEKEMLRVCDKFGGDVMKYYGPQFFEKLPNLINSQVIKHFVYGEGREGPQILGCHDKKLFLSELHRQGKVLLEVTQKGHPDLIYYQYKLYQRKPDLSFIQPLQISVGKAQEKTVIHGLEIHQNDWKQLAQEALEESVLYKRFPIGEGGFEGETKGLRFIFYYYQKRITSLFPKGAP